MNLSGWVHAGKVVVGVGMVLQLVACGPEVAPGPVSTGQTLCQNNYNVCVDPIFNSPMRRSNLDTVTCASGGCHEVGAGFGGSFKIYPNAAPASIELQANFLVSRAFANLTAPPSSKLLLEPLTGTSSITGSHTGGDIFTGTGDPCYVAILNWISTSVSDQSDPRCASCTPPVLASCGY